MSVLDYPTVMYPPEPQKLWTVEEFHKLQDLGILEKCELIEGVIIDKTGQGGRHAQLIRALMQALANVFGLERLMVQLPIQFHDELGRLNEPLPDVAVTRDGYTAYDENPNAADMLLVIEVSDSSLRSDLTSKALLYAKAGIIEYWVLDVEKRRVVVHSNPSDKGYLDTTERRQGETVSPLARPDSGIAVAKLFPQGKESN